MDQSGRGQNPGHHHRCDVPGKTVLATGYVLVDGEIEIKTLLHSDQTRVLACP